MLLALSRAVATGVTVAGGALERPMGCACSQRPWASSRRGYRGYSVAGRALVEAHGLRVAVVRAHGQDVKAVRVDDAVQGTGARELRDGRRFVHV